MIERRDRRSQLAWADGGIVVRVDRSLRKLGARGLALHRRIGNAATCDSDEPSRGIASPRIEAPAVTKRALERLARHVFGVRTCADAVGHICVDAVDERTNVG